ncbi:MAG: hypothetical protein OXE94_12180 [Aestuariivita sp.]|nr:hypothetical protein [Aestuariivita sp.]MCY4201299.1 hypothetical protein [Aestuariivita sp.]
MRISVILENTVTGGILLILGLAFFAIRLYYIDLRKRKGLMKALETEISRMRVVSDDEIELLRQKIEKCAEPLIVLDSAQPVFDGCSRDLSLLDKETLNYVVLVYTYDRFVSKALSGFANAQFKTFPMEVRMRAFTEFEKFNEAFIKYRNKALRCLSGQVC